MRRLLIGAVLIASLAPASYAEAQVSFGLAVGPTFPTGGLGDLVDTGLHGGIVADLGVPLLPVGIRGDLMVQHLPGSGGRDDFQQISGVVNGRLSLLPVPLLLAYLTAGAGLYGSRYEGDAPETPGGGGTRLDPGLNGGLGVRLNLLLIRPFLELRYHRVAGDPSRAFIPVSVGAYF